VKLPLLLITIVIALLLFSANLYAENTKSVSTKFIGKTLLAQADSTEAANENAAEEEFEDDFEDEEFEEDEFDDDFDDEFAEEYLKAIADPLEPFNRAMFKVNDKLYFWVLKPVAKGYNVIMPLRARVGVKRFFINLRTPIRLVNALLQFKIKDAGTELARFSINTTVGILGFMDPAKDKWKISIKKEDTGQTLGFYRLGPGFYIVWPVLGPSSLRDTVGMVGDSYLNPVYYAFDDSERPWGPYAVDAYRRFNSLSLNLGMYEQIKADSLDPYIFIRDAYHQYRENQIRE
jgi:phospholipid-binding lipoprotein MlaA